MNTSTKHRSFWHAAAATLLINGLLFVGAAPILRADEHDRCRHRIEKAEARLDHEIARHGEHSPQAEEKRRQLNEERERCWREYHGWWDGHSQQWHTDHDWDHDEHH